MIIKKKQKQGGFFNDKIITLPSLKHRKQISLHSIYNKTSNEPFGFSQNKENKDKIVFKRNQILHQNKYIFDQANRTFETKKNIKSSLEIKF